MRSALISISVFCMLIVPCVVRAQVTVRETQTTVPTYLVGEPQTIPYFFTGRTYQGAAGHVYPYPIYDILTDERVDTVYKYLSLENEYIKIGVLPEIGGRIFSAVDKSNDYNFFYGQHVIRPALIGMIGSWISGGVEWNVPHHHRASSTLNAGYEIVENEDGSKSIWIGETELRQRLKWDVVLTVYPGKSYVEAKFLLQNRTPFMQSFLYWANVSVHANENYQVQFPPQTVYGTTHSKTDYSDWPYARMDGNGNAIDDSWWASFTDSNSTFAVNYTDNYLVGYDFGKDAGTAHWANHHVVPGKKFFLWGTESVWNEMLTEDDGAYLELMVGTFSDNQPDYSWIGPNEVRETKQYWYPIKGIGGAKAATLEAAVNLERKSPEEVVFGFNATSDYNGARIVLKDSENVLLDETVDIDPDTPVVRNVSVTESVKDDDMVVALYDSEGTELVSYCPKPKPEVERPHPADRPSEPADYGTVEELLLAAQRVEEFHNGRIDPIPYYEEVLKRDPLNSRANVNLGIHYAKQTEWEKAERYLQNAYMRLTGLHYMPEVDKTGIIYQTNPKDGEMFYYLGIVSMQLGKTAEAEAYFWKSTWYPGFQSPAYLYIAELYWQQGRQKDALSAIDNSIKLSGDSTLAKYVKAHFLSETGDKAAAEALLRANIGFDKLDFLSRIALCIMEKDWDGVGETVAHMGIPLQEVLEVCTYFGAVGACGDAVALLDYCINNCPAYASTPMQKNAVEPFTASPLLNYMVGYYTNLQGDNDKALAYYRKAASMSPDYCFPSRLEEKKMLEDVISLNPSDGNAYYYLGNLLYYLEQKDNAINVWKEGVAVDSKNAMALRNLGFSANNHLKDLKLSADYYKQAIEADNTVPTFFTEYDKVAEALKVPCQERLAFLDENSGTVLQNDDATTRLVTLYVENGEYDKALSLLDTRHFRVWEGGVTVYNQFVDAHLLRGLRHLSDNQNNEALEDFLVAGTFPRNLETNELSTGPTVSKVAYHQGLAYLALGLTDKANESFEKCIDTATEIRRFPGAGSSDEMRYYLAMAYLMLGQEQKSGEVLSELDKTVSDALASEGAASGVDVYSKFGEDGSADTITAGRLYVKGLVSLAGGDESSAREHFDSSLNLNPSNVWAKYYLSTIK